MYVFSSDRLERQREDGNLTVFTLSGGWRAEPRWRTRGKTLCFGNQGVRGIPPESACNSTMK